MRSHRSLISVEDFRLAARRRLPRVLFDYVDGGADDELTVRANRRAFDAATLLPANGVWVPEPDLATELFGRRLSMPILTAPCGGMRLLHPHGDEGVARAAAAAGTLSIVPCLAGFTVEDVMARAPGPKWFQLYGFDQRGIMEGLVSRAAAAGYEALVCTIDTPVFGNREKDSRNGFSSSNKVDVRAALRMLPQALSRPGWSLAYCRDGLPFEFPNAVLPGEQRPAPSMSQVPFGQNSSASPTWEDLQWIRAAWSGPLIVKGVLTRGDTERAAQIGADGVIVSNHGGRQLDGAPASLTALAEVAAAADGRLEVLLDSGVRRGTDVVKALALGARSVLIGRPIAWGLAVAGESGARAVLEVLRNELIRALRLLGCSSVAELGPDVIGTLD